MFNGCMSSLDAPQDWLTTILVGVLKSGKSATSPEGLSTGRIGVLRTEGVDSADRQSVASLGRGKQHLARFTKRIREGYRTHNNSFVLRTAIEKAPSQGKTLVAFIDLLPTLWSKLFKAGPLFDWLQMLYGLPLHTFSHVKQADDVALFSTALQQKLDRFLEWCDVNFMTISAPKLMWMIII
jgi:hypothetical protein